MSVLDNIDPHVIGERLKESRVAAGITQETAAQKIGVARTTLVAVEKGDRRVRDDEFVNLSKLYNVPASSLLNPSEPAAESVVRYRKDLRVQKRAPKSQDAVKLLIDLASAACDLEDLVGGIRVMPAIPSYPISRRDIRTQAEDAAMALRQFLEIGLTPVSNIFSLIEIELGVRVFTRPIDSSIAGVYLNDERLGHCVLLNSKHPIARRTFTATHELGHAVSLPGHIDIFDSDHSDSPQEEKFANQFACMFLMPPRTVRKQFDIYKTQGAFSGYNLLAMADSFHVSPNAMCLWLEELGLLKQGTYDSISERGFSSKPAKMSTESHFKLFLPIRTSLLIADALSSGALSEGQLLKMFKLDRLEFRNIMDAIDYERWYD
jgi:Zn-dependent peptidase ImmA (M78 family)/DNA-binding XRE family transcriptional regulator